jgi:signal transduction histidine kinase
MEDFIQTNKLILLGKLTASLVHEIRNPLSAIKLNLDYLKMAQDDLPLDIQDVVNESLSAFEQVNFLIEDVLDFTRKPVAKIHSVSLEAVTDRCLKILSISSRNKGITIMKEFESELPILSINKNKVMQIFMNLINNAIEASSEKSRIIIRCSKQNLHGNEVSTWQIQDFGIGIKSEDKEKIVNGFFTTKNEGHGIGLGVCKTLANELNAEITFESEYGKGTTFFVQFCNVFQLNGQ